MDEKAAQDASKKPKAAPGGAVITAGTDDSRPVLKRAPGSGGDSGSGSQSTQTTTSSDSDRPVMKRPASDSTSKPTMGPTDDTSPNTSTSAKPQTQVDDHDSDRPVMKRPTSASSQTGGANTAQAASSESDPNRPTLSHTSKPKPPTTNASDLATPKEALAAGTAKGARSYPAISDAGDYRGRPMLYSMSPGERKTQEDQVLQLALDEIRAFAAKRNGPAIAKTAAIADYDVRAFDLDYSSSPTIVLTAKLPVKDPKANLPPDFTYFVTIVARVDINDQPIKIYSSVTDSRHLDAFPRQELIDALDADANGRGDLLFRQYSDNGISYALYRVSAYQLDKVFEGGSAL